MKKYLLFLTALLVVSACSSDNSSKQSANDSYEKYATTPAFVMLDTAGLALEQDKTYQLPNIEITKGTGIDIRPPSNPMAIIGNSVAQFDGHRSSIVYSADKKAVYNLQQIERLLNEQHISFHRQDNVIQTDWTITGRSDDIGDTQIRYQIEEIGNKEANALVLSISEMKRNGIIFTPSVNDKQRYSSDRLNQLVGELNAAYRIQQQQLNTDLSKTIIPSSLVTDTNGRTSLALEGAFQQSWHKLGQVLPELGFKITQEKASKGYRELKYRAIDKKEWLRLGVERPDLERGEYYMQLTAEGKYSALILSDEDKQALSGEQAQAVYQALKAVLAK